MNISCRFLSSKLLWHLLLYHQTLIYNIPGKGTCYTSQSILAKISNSYPMNFIKVSLFQGYYG